MPFYRICPEERNCQSLTSKCLVLDLDETLVHSCDDRMTLLGLPVMTDPKYFQVRGRVYNFSTHGYGKSPDIWGTTRPHLRRFITFCFNYFKCICVWSAGTKNYVDCVVERIFPSGYYPHLVYSRDDCHISDEHGHYKPLTELIKDEKNSMMNLQNTFVLDDRKETFIENPDNAILIPPYQPEPTLDAWMEDDTCLLQLMDWLNQPEVIRARDVRSLQKSSIFN